MSKFYDRQPLYHLAKGFRDRFNFDCPRQTLARWVINSAKELQPLVNLIQETIVGYDVTACDPTHLQVLKEPGRGAQEKSYVFAIRGGPPDKASIRYVYNPSDHKLFLQHWFEGYKGYVLVDGQNIFDVFESSSSIQLHFCHSHARRKFEPIANAATKPGLANEAMHFYQALYRIEREAKRAHLTVEQRYALRREKSQPLLDRFDEWVTENQLLVLPKSPLGVALAYVAKRRAGLRVFLEDGRLEIDTNALEQKNKYMALARNGFLFSDSVAGAEAIGVHMTLIFTALEHQLDPYHYYVHIMKRIPHCKTVEDYELLLPWQVKYQWQAKAA